MFKKTLVALALAGVSTVATAGTVSLNDSTTFAAAIAPDISVEGYAAASNKKLEAGNGFAAGTLVTIKADTAYVANDVVILTVENGTFDTTVTGLTVATESTAGTPDATPKASMLDYSSATTLRLRLGGAIEKNGVIRVTGLKITPSSAADKDEVKLNSSVLSSNATIGTYDKGTAVKVAEFSQEFVLGTVTKFNGEVSTGKGRQEFTGTSNLADQVAAPITKTTALELALTPTEVNYTLSASNLSFAADYDLKVNGGNEDGKLSDAELKKAFVTTSAATQTLSINDGYTALSIKDTAAAGLNLTATVIGNAKGGAELTAPQGFNLTAKVKHTGGEFAVKGLDAASVGAWTLDGSSGDVKFLPFSKDFVQGVTVTNSGTVVGEITAEIWFKGKKYSGVVGEAAANTVTSISGNVKNLARDNGVDGDARVRITVNAPNCTVNALYYHKADGDRLTVPVLNK